MNENVGMEGRCDQAAIMCVFFVFMNMCPALLPRPGRAGEGGAGTDGRKGTAGKGFGGRRARMVGRVSATV